MPNVVGCLSGLPARLLLLLVVLAATPAMGQAKAASADVQHPRTNLVFILVDDMGYGDLSCYGAPDVRTPRIDRLAAQGVRFTCYYAAGAECTPTRTAFLTGRYPQRVGGLECAIGTGNVGRYDDAIRLAEQHELGLPPQESILANSLKRAGYSTAVFGKWHLGYEPKFNPLQLGFDEFTGILGGNADYFLHTELSPLPVFYRNRRPIRRDGYLTHLITDDAIDYIRRHRRQPFFLYVAYTVPHFPYQGPHDRADKPLPAEKWTAGTREKYVEMLADMDGSVGRLLDALDANGLAERTLVVFSSDHGGTGPGRNEPFRGKKGGLFEGGIRTACLARWPGRIQPGTVCDQPTITMDFTVSLMRIAGAEPPPDRPLDGIDILGHVAERRPTFERTLFWRARRGSRTWKAVRDGRMKYVERREGTQQDAWLFDLAADPQEQHDLRGRRPDVVQRLKEKLADWEREVAPRR